jgi:hypothetical protein
MSVERWWYDTDGKTYILGGRTFANAAVSTTDPTWNGLGSTWVVHKSLI